MDKINKKPEISPLTSDKPPSQQDPFCDNPSIDSFKLLYARIMIDLLEKTSIDQGVDLSHLPASEQEIYTLVSTLSFHLKTLSNSDQSKNNSFTKSLSSNWHFLTLSIKRREGQKLTIKYLPLLKDLIHSIEIYGDKEGKTLGYYLNIKQMQDWFPLPYLKMLYSLYQETINDPLKSSLAIWQEKIKYVLLIILYPS